MEEGASGSDSSDSEDTDEIQNDDDPSTTAIVSRAVQCTHL